ncbi:MAG: TSUP family transporter [Gaiellaceae bacterium]
MLRLAVIGVVAGFFSALFGVGGGLVIVPLLLLIAHFAERPAMATSLGAIAFTALAGTIRYGFHGDVEWGYAALIGLPASLGAVVGTAVQQRMRQRWLSLAFAALLVVVGVLLLTT